MSGPYIHRKGASKLKRSQSIRLLLLFTCQRVFNQGRTLKEEVGWKSRKTLRIYGDGTGGFKIHFWPGRCGRCGMLDWYKVETILVREI